MESKFRAPHSSRGCRDLAQKVLGFAKKFGLASRNGGEVGDVPKFGENPKINLGIVELNRDAPDGDKDLLNHVQVRRQAR